jgi:hypothetical protein
MRQRLARVERFRQIIVRAHLEPEDAIDVLAARGEHDDQDRRFRAQFAAQRQPALAGQHDVENQEIDTMTAHDLRHLAAVSRRGDVAGAQVFRDQGPRLAIVLDDENVGGCLVYAGV